MEAKLIKFLEAVIEDYNYYNEENPEQGSAEWGVWLKWNVHLLISAKS